MFSSTGRTGGRSRSSRRFAGVVAGRWQHTGEAMCKVQAESEAAATVAGGLQELWQAGGSRQEERRCAKVQTEREAAAKVAV
jgi:hypothetical protein